MTGHADTAAEQAHSVVSAWERVEAVSKGTVSTTTPAATRTHVAFGKRNKAETIQAFTETELTDIVAGVFAKTATASRRNTKTAKNVLSMSELVRTTLNER